MSEIERGAYALPLLWIAGDVVHLHLQAQAYHLEDEIVVPRKYPIPVLGEEPNQPAVMGEERMLDHLSQTAHVLALRQRPQAGWGDQYITCGIERSHEVLASVEVDGALASYGCIDHAQQGRRHEHESTAPHEDACGERGHVAHNTSAEADEEAVAPQMCVEGRREDLLDGRPRLELLAAWQDDVVFRKGREQPCAVDVEDPQHPLSIVGESG